MKSIDIKRERIHSVWFFLKTIFLSPVLNPVFPVFLAASVFLVILGNIQPPDVLFMMCIVALSTAGTGELFKNDRQETAPFLYLNPLPLKAILKRMFFASSVFSVLSQAVFLLVLVKAMTLPKLGNAHIEFFTSGTGEIISVLAGYIVDISGRVEIPIRKMLRPSLIFGVVKSAGGWNVSLHYWVGIAVFFTVSSMYTTMSSVVSVFGNEETVSRLIRYVLISGLLGAGCLFLVDMVFPSEIIWNLRNAHWNTVQWILLTCMSVYIVFSLYALVRLYLNLDGL